MRVAEAVQALVGDRFGWKCLVDTSAFCCGVNIACWIKGSERPGPSMPDPIFLYFIDEAAARTHEGWARMAAAAEKAHDKTIREVIAG